MAGKQGGKRGQLRIIGGEWRGRKLRFPLTRGLRPTPDRVRETLFNWLSAPIVGARCLDLFAGSGALGLEALSRGAAFCDFVDNSPASVDALREHLAVLGCEQASVRRGDAMHALATAPAAPFDVVFLDPPFGEGLLGDACEALEQQGWLRAGSHIYLESSIREPLPPVPGSWQEHRCKEAGEVRYQLFVRAG